MARKKNDRPEWFKFWRRNRQQLDTDLLSMESRGKIFTNMMRYFDGGETELVELSPLESMAFNVIKVNIDDSFTDWKEKSEKATSSINQRWHRDDDTDVYGRIQSNTKYTEDRRESTEERIQSTEDRGQKIEERGKIMPPSLDEVRQFADENGFRSDPEVFFNYYAARGWKVGNDVISNWEALFLTWEKREKTSDNPFFQKLEEEKKPKEWNIVYDA